jgi:hypothetical protein
MIVIIFSILLFIVVFLITVGYTTKQIYMLFLAYGLLFSLAVILMTSGIDYVSGKVMVDNGMTTVITDVLTSYSDPRMGMYLAFISVGAFAVTMFQYRRLVADE